MHRRVHIERNSLLALSLSVWCLILLVASARAQVVPPPQAFEVREIAPIEGLSGEALTEEEILAIPVPIVRAEGVLDAPAEGAKAVQITIAEFVGETITDRALRAALERIPVAFGERGFRGIVVTVDERALSDGTLRIQVIEGRVGEVRTILRREDMEASVNDPRSRRVRGLVPVREREEESAGDLIRVRDLDRFAHFLSRHPNRRADIALAPGPPTGQEGDVTLDVLLTESDPFSIYFQASNTGTEETSEWRERVGLNHFNLTGEDDILNIDYVTGDFEDVHAVFGSYDRPLGFDGRLRGRVYASFSRFDASELGDLLVDFNGETTVVGGELALNVYQDGPAFVDLVAGLRYEHHEVENTLGIDSENDFLLPSIGARLERRDDAWNLDASATLEFNLPGAAGTDEETIDELGRFDADDEWVTLRYGARASAYLDSVFADGGARSRVHEVMLSLRGQESFENRLPPGFTDVAGGLYTVRGFPESFTSGDRTFLATAEYRLHASRLLTPYDEGEETGELFGDPFYWRPTRPGGPSDWDAIVRAFVDVARVESVDGLVFERDETLLSAGVGIELAIKRGFRARLDWGVALRDAESSDERVESGDSELHLVFTLVF